MAARSVLPLMHFIRKTSPETSIEILTPDFLRKESALEIVVEARPDVFNHNQKLYRVFISASGARYFHPCKFYSASNSLTRRFSPNRHGRAGKRAKKLCSDDDMRSADTISSLLASIYSRRANMRRLTGRHTG